MARCRPSLDQIDEELAEIAARMRHNDEQLLKIARKGREKMTCMYWRGDREGCDAPLIPRESDGAFVECPGKVGEYGCKFGGEPEEEAP